MKGDETRLQLKRLREEGCKVNRNKTVRNRRYVRIVQLSIFPNTNWLFLLLRYAALQRLLRSDDTYFSEDSMRRRNPLLWERLVRRNLTEEERRAAISASSSGLGSTACSLTNIILEHVDLNRERELKKVDWVVQS